MDLDLLTDLRLQGTGTNTQLQVTAKLFGQPGPSIGDLMEFLYGAMIKFLTRFRQCPEDAKPGYEDIAIQNAGSSHIEVARGIGYQVDNH